MKTRKLYTNAKMETFSARPYKVPAWDIDGDFTIPVLVIPLDAESVAQLREKVSRAIMESMWPSTKTQLMCENWLEHGEAVLKSLGLPVRPSGKKKGN